MDGVGRCLSLLVAGGWLLAVTKEFRLDPVFGLTTPNALNNYTVHALLYIASLNRNTCKNNRYCKCVSK